MKAVTLKYTVQTVNEWRAGYSESCKSGSGASVRKPTAAMRQGAGYLAYGILWRSKMEKSITVIPKAISLKFGQYQMRCAENTDYPLFKPRNPSRGNGSMPNGRPSKRIDQHGKPRSSRILILSLPRYLHGISSSGLWRRKAIFFG